MLASIFGDDEHTALEGPYSRLMKVRKWLFLTGGLGALVAFGHFDWTLAPQWMQVIELPALLVGRALFWGGVYLTLVYILLLGQTARIYDIVLTERFASRRSDELAGVRAKIRDLSSELQKARESKFSAITEQLERARRRMNELARHKSGRKSSDIALIGLSDEEIQAEFFKTRDEADRLMRLITEESRSNPHRDAEDLSDHERDLITQLNAARRDHEAIAALNPAARATYRHLETAIDVIRVIPPLIFAVWALVIVLGFTGYPWTWAYPAP